MSSPSTIDAALADCIARAEANGISLEDTLVELGPASFCFVCLLLSVPFLQPFSLGPLTMASGLAFMACGWQMTRNRATPLLPAAIRRTRLHGKRWLVVLRLCQRVLVFCRRFTKPRKEEWVTGPAGERFVGWLILVGGFLLAIPCANLPFNDTLPALMILFAALAWLERDGFMIFISLFWGVVTLLYFILVGLVLWLFGTQIAAWIHHLGHH